jgi:hypothetical protein
MVDDAKSKGATCLMEGAQHAAGQLLPTIFTANFFRLTLIRLKLFAGMQHGG